MYNDLHNAVSSLYEFQERVRSNYDATKELTTSDTETCMTIRVPVSLLNRIRELKAIYEIEVLIGDL